MTDQDQYGQQDANETISKPIDKALEYGEAVKPIDRYINKKAHESVKKYNDKHYPEEKEDTSSKASKEKGNQEPKSKKQESTDRAVGGDKARVQTKYKQNRVTDTKKSKSSEKNSGISEKKKLSKQEKKQAVQQKYRTNEYKENRFNNTHESNSNKYSTKSNKKIETTRQNNQLSYRKNSSPGSKATLSRRPLQNSTVQKLKATISPRTLNSTTVKTRSLKSGARVIAKQGIGYRVAKVRYNDKFNGKTGKINLKRNPNIKASQKSKNDLKNTKLKATEKRKQRIQATRKQSESQLTKNRQKFDGSPVAKMGGVKQTKLQTKKRLTKSDVKRVDKAKRIKSISRKKLNNKKLNLKGENWKKKFSIKNSKKKLSKKLEKSLKKNIKPSNRFRSFFKKMLLDKIGRSEDGSLNIIGILIALLLLIPILIKLVVITTVASVIMAILAVIAAIFAWIGAIFTMKTEDMAIGEAYVYVTKLDEQTNELVRNAYNRFVKDSSVDKVYFKVNNLKADINKFHYRSDGEKYLYYFNAKYENYDIDKSISKNNNIWGVKKVKDEYFEMHNATFYYTVNESEEVVKQTITKEDPETGEITEEVVETKQKVATINVITKTIAEFSDEHPENMPKEDMLDRFTGVAELDRFENKIMFGNPFKDTPAIVIKNYGYRDGTKNKSDQVLLQAKEGTPVYATDDHKIESTKDGVVVVFSNGRSDRIEIDSKYKITYSGLKNIQVHKGQEVEEGKLLGYVEDDYGLMLFLKENRAFWADPHLYPPAYFEDMYPQYDTSLGYTVPGGGITGNLISPSESVTRWDEAVTIATTKYGIPEYKNTVLAIIWEETGGNSELYPDIMQASESQGLAPNTIKDPLESIDVGVSYFAELIMKASEKGLAPEAAVQAYNYGGGFIDYLKEHELPYSFDNGKLFAKRHSDGKIVEYNNPVAKARGYSWRYKYGNMFYTDLVSQHIMQTSTELLDLAIDEVGKKDGSMYWEWYGFEERVEWCAIFISWLADQTGYLEEGRLIKTASCLEMINWLREEDQYISNGDYVPKPGDLIFFDWSGNGTGKDHVGIVEFTDGNTVQTIEGNSNDQVKRQSYSLSSQFISGYGIVAGPKDVEETETVEIVPPAE